jgi:hypothetical protein
LKDFLGVILVVTKNRILCGLEPLNATRAGSTRSCRLKSEIDKKATHPFQTEASKFKRSYFRFIDQEYAETLFDCMLEKLR